jgi:hypothetical protein
MSKEERPKEYTAFEQLTDQLLTVSKAELDAKVRAHKAAAAANPNRRGPKPKVKPSASGRDVSGAS